MKPRAVRTPTGAGPFSCSILDLRRRFSALSLGRPLPRPPARTIRQPAGVSNKNGRALGPAVWRFVRFAALVAAGSEQLQQHHEQVDEVEIESQRAHDRGLAGG